MAIRVANRDRRASMTTKEDRAEAHLEHLISRLPARLARAIRRLRHGQSRWLRLPVALGFLLGAVFSFLPVLGIWMLPVGLLLLAEDFPPARVAVYAGVNWVADRRPHWFR
jgi:hypothetical protein